MLLKISSVVKALNAHNGALRLDHVLSECGIKPTPENLHDAVKLVEGWRLGWTAEDEDARIALPANGGGNAVGLATTKAQTRFEVPETVYQTRYVRDDGTVSYSYEAFPDDPRVQKRERKTGAKEVKEVNRWIPCLVLCNPSLLVKRADMSSDVMDALDNLPDEFRGMFGEIKSARPSTTPGWAMVNMLVRVTDSDE